MNSQQPRTALVITKEHQIFTHDLHVLWFSTRLDFFRETDGLPIPAEQLPEGGTQVRSGEEFILLLRQHVSTPFLDKKTTF
jgi:hypothetical protein